MFLLLSPRISHGGATGVSGRLYRIRSMILSKMYVNIIGRRVLQVVNVILIIAPSVSRAGAKDDKTTRHRNVIILFRSTRAKSDNDFV